MYHVSGKPFYYTQNILTSEGITEGDWAQFSEADLLTNHVYGNGSYSWCQDQAGVDTVARGYDGVSYIFPRYKSATFAYMGWRPCLELVE